MFGSSIVDSVPSSFMMSPPAAHTDGQKVKTKQPGQLPPKKVPYVLPPTFSRIVLACSAISFIVVGGVSGSRPAFL